MQAAAEAQGSIERHVKVAAFALSFYQGNVRTTKPTAPVLGETLEVVDECQGFRLLLEEVGSCPQQPVKPELIAQLYSAT